MKNREYVKDMLTQIFSRLKQLPMKRSTDWIMEIIKERVELNLDVISNDELTIRLSTKSIQDLDKLPEKRQQTDFNISLLRDKFECIIRLMYNPDNEYENGGDQNSGNRTKTATERLDERKSDGNNG